MLSIAVLGGGGSKAAFSFSCVHVPHRNPGVLIPRDNVFSKLDYGVDGIVLPFHISCSEHTSPQNIRIENPNPAPRGSNHRCDPDRPSHSRRSRRDPKSGCRPGPNIAACEWDSCEIVHLRVRPARDQDVSPARERYKSRKHTCPQHPFNPNSHTTPQIVSTPKTTTTTTSKFLERAETVETVAVPHL